MLFIPILVDVTSKEKNIIDSNLEMFTKIGYVLENFGENTIKISGVPSIGYEIDFKSMFMDTVDEILGATRTNTQDKEARFIYTVACKAAVKANMQLSETEHRSLIEDMMKLDSPFTCPHGRPTAYEITRYEIERRFLRK
ncbi:DNA mismatch repair protein MutL [compost metagenome]